MGRDQSPAHKLFSSFCILCVNIPWSKQVGKEGEGFHLLVGSEEFVAIVAIYHLFPRVGKCSGTLMKHFSQD